MSKKLYNPEKIYLQVDPDGESAVDWIDGVTWCQDRINSNDVEYVRSDIKEKIENELREEKDHSWFLERLLSALYGWGWDKLTIKTAQDEMISNNKLRQDKLRLDYLDECNRRLNEHCGTKYGWKLIQSHLVNRLMFKDLDSHTGGVDLNDAEAHGFRSVRLAIDEKMHSK